MYFPYSHVFSASSLRSFNKYLRSFSSIVIFLTMTLVNLLKLTPNWLIAESCVPAALLCSCGLSTNFFFPFTIATLSIHVSAMFFVFLIFSQKFSFLLFVCRRRHHHIRCLLQPCLCYQIHRYLYQGTMYLEDLNKQY